jgi:hypothetical protein
MNKNEGLRQKTINQIQHIFKDAPTNEHFLPILWKGFAECQTKWVKCFFPAIGLSKQDASPNKKIIDVPSEVQGIVGWAV